MNFIHLLLGVLIFIVSYIIGFGSWCVWESWRKQRLMRAVYWGAKDLSNYPPTRVGFERLIIDFVGGVHRVIFNEWPKHFSIKLVFRHWTWWVPFYRRRARQRAAELISYRTPVGIVFKGIR